MSMQKFKSANRKRGSAPIVGASAYVRIETPTILELATLQGQAINYTPTLLVGDGTGTWTAEGLPTGASINSSTGQITGTLSTLGSHACMVTYTEGALTDSVIHQICVYDQVDTTTLAGGTVSSPQNPTSSTFRLFRLQADLDADYTAIACATGGNGCLIDLNGYTVTYDNAAQPFAIGTDWTNSASISSTWTLGSGDTIEQGTFNLQSAPVDNWYAIESTATASESRSVETTASFSLVQDTWYVVNWWQSQGNSSRSDDFSSYVVVGSNDSSVTPTGGAYLKSPNSRPGSYGAYLFKAASTESAPIEIHFTNVDSSTRTVHISDVMITRARVTGICAASSTDQHPYATGAGSSYRAVVVNGTITQTGVSSETHAIYADQDVIFDNLTITTNPFVIGKYGQAIAGIQQGYTVTNCTVETNCTRVSDRDGGDGNLIRGYSGASKVGPGMFLSDNTCTSSPLGFAWGLGAEGTYDYAGYNKWNTHGFTCRYTNGYPVHGFASSGQVFHISHNNIDFTTGTRLGRGIRADSNTNIHHNTVKVRMLQGYIQEYYGGWILGGAYGIQIEDSDTTNVYQHDDVITLTGMGGGGAWRFNGTLLEDTGIDVLVENCTFITDVTGDSIVDGSGEDSICVKIGRQTATTPDLSFIEHRDCTYKTNYHLFQIDATAFLNKVQIVRPHIHIVNGPDYTEGEAWIPFTSGGMHFIDPTFEDAFSETEFNAAIAADSLATTN